MTDERTERERLAAWLRNQRPSLAECEPDCGCNWCRYDRAAALLTERTGPEHCPDCGHDAALHCTRCGRSFRAE